MPFTPLLAGSLEIANQPKLTHQIPTNKNEIWDALPTVMPKSSGFNTNTKQISCKSTEPIYPIINPLALIRFRSSGAAISGK